MELWSGGAGDKEMQMTEKPRRPGSFLVLVGGILIAVAVVVIFLVPFANCPMCDVSRAIERGLSNLRGKARAESDDPLPGCKYCRNGKVTLYRKWTYSP